MVPPIGLGLCAAAAYGVHWLVHGERVDDGTGLALTAAMALALVLTLVGSVRAATRGFAWRRPASLQLRCAGLLPPLAVVLIGILFGRASLIDTSVAMAALVDTDRTQPAQLALGPTGEDVRLTGELTEGVADRLAAMLDAHPRIGRIHLTSEGGLADEGLVLGEVIAAHALVTFVPDYCISACTLAFSRGRERLAMDDARLGFHAPYEQGLFGALYRDDSGGQRAAYLAAGIAPDFVEHALAVEPADIWMPEQAQLLAAGVVTRIVDHDTLPDSSLDGAATPAGARAFVLQNFPVLHALAARRPAAMATIARWYLDAYNSGRPEGESGRGLRLMVRGAVASALAHADDRVLRDLARFLGRAADVATEPASCARIAEEGDLVEAATQLKASDPEAVAGAAGLLDRALRSDAAAVTAVPQPATMRSAAGCTGLRRDLAALADAPEGLRQLRARLGASILRSLAVLPRGLPSGQPPG